MCITLSVKLGEEVGQNRHCPGVNGCMIASGASIDPSKDVGVQLVSGLDDRLIGEVDNGAVVVEVVAVVVTSIPRRVGTDGLEVVGAIDQVKLESCDCTRASMIYLRLNDII